MLTVVKFLRKYKGFNPGETAGVFPDTASGLIAQKYAEPFEVRGAITKTTASSTSAEVPALTPPVLSKRKPGRPRKVNGAGKDAA